MGLPLLNKQNTKPVFFSIYRTLLRNIKQHVYSLNFQKELQVILRKKIDHELTNDHSGAKDKRISLNNSLRKFISDLKKLNNKIVEQDLLFLKRFRLLNVAPISPIHINAFENGNIVEDPQRTYEKKILHEFIRHEQFKNFNIPLPGKEGLASDALLPLAMHRYYMNRLKHVEQILSKPPQTLIKGTRSYFGRMWFLKNFLTKRRQSKKLSMFLGLTRRSGEYHLQLWKLLGDNRIDYSIMEAQWEHELAKTVRTDSEILQEDTQSSCVSYEDYTKEAYKVLGKVEDPVFQWKNTGYRSKIHELNEWLDPLLLNFDMVSKRVKTRSDHLENYRVEVLPKIYNSRHNLAMKVYNQNIERWNTMCKEDLPHCNPFDPKNDLKSILLKYNFLRKKPSITST